MPRAGSSGVEQEGAATIPRTGSNGKSGPYARGRIVPGGSSRKSRQPPDWRVQGKVAPRSEGDMRPRPKWCGDGVMSGCSEKDNSIEMQ